MPELQTAVQVQSATPPAPPAPPAQPPNGPAQGAAPDAAIYSEAYQRVIDRLNALAPEEVQPINLDIPAAVTRVIGALPRIMSFRSRIVAELPKFDLSSLDEMTSYTLALAHTHTRFQMASAPPDRFDEAVDKASHARELLFADVSVLALRGLLDGSRLKELKGPNGYRNLVFDLFLLSGLVRTNWSGILGRTALTLEELDQVEMAGDRLLNGIAYRENAAAEISLATDQRARAFTVFVRSYDEIRRAITFLRWHEDDQDIIAPSLYAGRGPRHRVNHTPDDEGPSTDGSDIDGLTSRAMPDPTLAAATAPSVAAPSAAEGPSNNNAQSSRGATGLPGANPFLNG